jgi:hypothetical protein
VFVFYPALILASVWPLLLCQLRLDLFFSPNQVFKHHFIVFLKLKSNLTHNIATFEPD